jgi:rhomboid family GlyGly-CTERM serine protease
MHASCVSQPLSNDQTGRSSANVWSLPGCTFSLVLSCVTVGVALIPGAAEWLQFDRGAVAAGECWRIITGHFVHWNGDHLFWDLAVFALLGALCEGRNRWQIVAVLAIAGLLISAALWIFLPDCETYRGLSGIDSALFALVAANFLRDQWQEKRWGCVIAIAALFVGLIAKIIFELVTGTTLFVNSPAAGFEPLPLVHIVGAAVGLLPMAWGNGRRFVSQVNVGWLGRVPSFNGKPKATASNVND